MVDRALRQSPLAHLGLHARTETDAPAKAGVVLGEKVMRDQIGLRLDAADEAILGAAEKALGFALPVAANTASHKGRGGTLTTALWLGPDEWLIVCQPGRGHKLKATLEQALAGRHHAVFDVSDSRAVITLSGDHSRDVLMKGCALDFHPRAFGPGQCAQSTLALAHVLIHQTSEDAKTKAAAYDIFVHRSFAEYLWAWLEDASAEYGLRVTMA